jgi:hypothetical protein
MPAKYDEILDDDPQFMEVSSKGMGADGEERRKSFG